MDFLTVACMVRNPFDSAPSNNRMMNWQNIWQTDGTLTIISHMPFFSEPYRSKMPDSLIQESRMKVMA